MRVELQARASRILYLVIVVAVSSLLGCGSTGQSETEHHHQAEEQHDDHDHSSEEHEEEQTSFDRSALDRIAGQQCEHDVPILDCDECRYEVGAVEVAPSLLDPDGDDLIRTTQLNARSIGRALQLTGEVSFDERRVAHVSPRVGGIVRQTHVSLGDRVEKGARLIVMDSLELGKLRSRYLQAGARLELAQKNYDRAERLHERRIASGREKLLAETTLRETKIELESAREQLRLVGLSSRGPDSSGAKQLRGGGTLLTSPVDGTVVSMHAVNGERVSPEESVITIADLSKVWVWADVYERDLAQLLRASKNTALQANVEVAAFEGQRFSGEVTYVGAVMEETTRTVKVRVDVDNTEGLLRPGMFANISIDLGEGVPTLVVPAEAVMEHEDQSFIFVKVGPHRFLRRDVTAKTIDGAQIALIDGVVEGEDVVVRGAFLLKSDVLREQMGAGCAH